MISKSELLRLRAMSQCENRLRAEGFTKIAGIDEAGRGPLAGPVVAACCLLPLGALFEHLNDSKQLTEEMRENLFSKITAYPGLEYGIGVVDVKTIDRINILQATLLAMQEAVRAMKVVPDYLLIDGNQIPHFDISSESVVAGDTRSISIAAASILAKVTRDRMMVVLSQKHPGYGFHQHKGYGTEMHLQAIQTLGPCPIHRKSFDPIKSIFKQEKKEKGEKIDGRAAPLTLRPRTPSGPI